MESNLSNDVPSSCVENEADCSSSSTSTEGTPNVVTENMFQEEERLQDETDKSIRESASVSYLVDSVPSLIMCTLSCTQECLM